MNVPVRHVAGAVAGERTYYFEAASFTEELGHEEVAERVERRVGKTGMGQCPLEQSDHADDAECDPF